MQFSLISLPTLAFYNIPKDTGQYNLLQTVSLKLHLNNLSLRLC